MKKLVFALISLCVPLTVAAQAPRTGVELAPSLTAIEYFSPETHRVLADGTYDTMTIDQRFEVVAEFFSSMVAANPKATEEVERALEEMGEGLASAGSLYGTDDEEDLNQILLQVLEGMDTTFSVVRRLGFERHHLSLKRDDVVEEVR